jgi:hypothetical protein
MLGYLLRTPVNLGYLSGLKTVPIPWSLGGRKSSAVASNTIKTPNFLLL